MMPNESPLTAWETFYVIMGSSAAALTGLQFVVIALVADRLPRSPGRDEGGSISAFGAPTVVHFAAVLLIAAILAAPWPALTGPALALGGCGVAGLGYVIVVINRARTQTGYQMVMEDWVWHVSLPLAAYATLLAASTVLTGHAVTSLFIIGGISVLLLFIAIHNAWDAVVYVAIDYVPPSDATKSS